MFDQRSSKQTHVRFNRSDFPCHIFFSSLDYITLYNILKVFRLTIQIDGIIKNQVIVIFHNRILKTEKKNFFIL